MTLETFGPRRVPFRFGNQEVNLHVRGHEFQPRAHLPVPGAMDLCFVAGCPLDGVIAALRAKGVAILEGPVPCTGATAPDARSICATPI